MKSVSFYQIRYWIVKNLLNATFSEEEKNKLFVEAFFVNRDVEINSNLYKIKILSRKNSFILGQLGRKKTTRLYTDIGPRIEEIRQEDIPYIYFFADTRVGEQFIYIKTDTSRHVYSSIKQLLKILHLTTHNIYLKKFM